MNPRFCRGEMFIVKYITCHRIREKVEGVGLGMRIKSVQPTCGLPVRPSVGQSVSQLETRDSRKHRV